MSRATGITRVLDEWRGVRAMTGVMAIMIFLTVLATALGLATASGARALDQQLAGRVTVQVMEGTSDGVTARTVAALRGSADVARVAPVSRADMARLLAPWLGDDGADAQLPIPALIDVDMRERGDAAVARVSTLVRRISPLARIDRHERWMSPVGGLMRTLTLVAIALVAMLVLATATVVVLAARHGLETHRATIEVMHMLGATDRQLAWLFQRRIAIDALVGGLIGGVLAMAVTALIGAQLVALGSALANGAMLRPGDWAMLAMLPLAFVLVAIVAARVTVRRAIGRMS